MSDHELVCIYFVTQRLYFRPHFFHFVPRCVWDGWCAISCDQPKYNHSHNRKDTEYPAYLCIGLVHHISAYQRQVGVLLVRLGFLGSDNLFNRIERQGGDGLLLLQLLLQRDLLVPDQQTVHRLVGAPVRGEAVLTAEERLTPQIRTLRTT